MVVGFHPEGIILGGKLQEVGVALYTFLCNCPKFWGGGGGGEEAPPPPPDETLGGKNNETSGLKLIIHHTNIQVSLVNITAQGNTGQYGGNLAISVSETIDSRFLSIRVALLMVEQTKVEGGDFGTHRVQVWNG